MSRKYSESDYAKMENRDDEDENEEDDEFINKSSFFR